MNVLLCCSCLLCCARAICCAELAMPVGKQGRVIKGTHVSFVIKDILRGKDGGTIVAAQAL